MKWFYVKFTSSELFTNSDATFVKEIITFAHSVKHPDEFGLYSLKFRLEEGVAYYISSPDNLHYKIKEILARYNSAEVSRPNLNLLTLEFGKSKLL